MLCSPFIAQYSLCVQKVSLYPSSQDNFQAQICKTLWEPSVWKHCVPTAFHLAAVLGRTICTGLMGDRGLRRATALFKRPVARSRSLPFRFFFLIRANLAAFGLIKSICLRNVLQISLPATSCIFIINPMYLQLTHWKTRAAGLNIFTAITHAAAVETLRLRTPNGVLAMITLQAERVQA